MRKGSLKNLLIIFATIDLIAIAGYVFIFSFINNLQSDIKDALAERNIALSQQDKISNSQHRASEIEPIVERLKTAVVPTDGVIGFIESLEQTAHSLGVHFEIKSVDVATAENEAGEESGMKTVSVGINIQGSFNQVENMIDALENIPLTLSIRRVRLERVGADELNEWRASLLLQVLQE